MSLFFVAYKRASRIDFRLASPAAWKPLDSLSKLRAFQSNVLYDTPDRAELGQRDRGLSIPESEPFAGSELSPVFPRFIPLFSQRKNENGVNLIWRIPRRKRRISHENVVAFCPCRRLARFSRARLRICRQLWRCPASFGQLWRRSASFGQLWRCSASRNGAVVAFQARQIL
jgi:hypothetical protein